MDFERPCKLDFKLEGPGLDKSIDLHELTVVFSEFHSTLDKTYAVLSGQQRLSKDARTSFHVEASDFRRGSFLTTLEIIIDGAQLTLPLLGFTNPLTIWEYTKSSFEFLKAVYTAKSEGKDPKIEIHNNSQVIVLVNNQAPLTFEDPRILEIAAKSKKNYVKLAETLNETGINNIKISRVNSQGSLGIAMDVGDKELFEILTEISEAPSTFYADIYDFNKAKNIGKLRLLDEQDATTGDYPFSVVGGQDASIYIQSMLSNRVKVTALEERENDPISGPKLIRFQVIKLG